jgi:hypothetical protein
MNYYWIAAGDQVVNNWLIYYQEADQSLKLRPKYTDLECKICGKVDEYAALKRGVDRDVRIISETNVVGTDDGFIVFDTSIVASLKAAGVTGVDYDPLPGDSRYSIVLPRHFARIDLATSGVSRRNLCKVCGRYQETLYLPMARSVSLPADPKTIVAPGIPMEGYKNQHLWLLASDFVANLFRVMKATGTELILAS